MNLISSFCLCWTASETLHPQPDLLQRPVHWQGGHPRSGQYTPCQSGVLTPRIFLQQSSCFVVSWVFFLFIWSTRVMYCGGSSNKAWHLYSQFYLFIPLILPERIWVNCSTVKVKPDLQFMRVHSGYLSFLFWDFTALQISYLGENCIF